MCTVCVWCPHQPEKTFDPLEPELQADVRNYVFDGEGDRNGTSQGPLEKQQVLLTAEPSLQPHV